MFIKPKILEKLMLLLHVLTSWSTHHYSTPNLYLVTCRAVLTSKRCEIILIRKIHPSDYSEKPQFTVFFAFVLSKYKVHIISEQNFCLEEILWPQVLSHNFLMKWYLTCINAAVYCVVLLFFRNWNVRMHK